LRTNLPSRPSRGALQLRHVISWSVVGPGGASSRTISYFAPQLEQWNSIGGGITFRITQRLRPAGGIEVPDRQARPYVATLLPWSRSGSHQPSRSAGRLRATSAVSAKASFLFVPFCVKSAEAFCYSLRRCASGTTLNDLRLKFGSVASTPPSPSPHERGHESHHFYGWGQLQTMGVSQRGTWWNCSVGTYLVVREQFAGC
jgi:hypothetical protein